MYPELNCLLFTKRKKQKIDPWYERYVRSKGKENQCSSEKSE